MPRYAAVDIGSNSVRLLVAESIPGAPIQILDQERSVTRLGASVFLHGRIAEDALQLLCGKLAKMGEIVRKRDVAGLRAVATSAVRDASNQREFLDRTQQALGAPIEIISGQEEARLIHAGVQLRWPQPGRTLIIDVGGGSVEIILSDGGALAQAFSKPLGAVRLAEVFLKDDPPSQMQLRQMDEYISEKLAGPAKCIQGPFDRAIATSATAAALVCAVNGIERSEREEADRLPAGTGQIRALYERLCAMDVAARRKVTGIGPKRADLIVAGSAVFLRSLDVFGQGSLHYSVAGVRDGLIADLAARRAGQDQSNLNPEQREAAMQMAVKYGVQREHTTQAAGLARTLFAGLEPLHRLAPHYGGLLEAAAIMHDVGHFVNPTGHHKHSHYLVENSELPGFTDSERHFIAALCRYHRKSAPTPGHSSLQSLDAGERRAIALLTPLLRLADSLDRGHGQRVRSIQVELTAGQALVTLESNGDLDLVIWAASRAADLFRATYNVPLLLKIAGAKNGL